jgi:hypothetical protein
MQQGNQVISEWRLKMFRVLNAVKALKNSNIAMELFSNGFKLATTAYEISKFKKPSSNQRRKPSSPTSKR